MIVRNRDTDEFSLDTWLALLAGPNSWRGGDEPSESWTRMLCLTQVFALVVTATTIAVGTTSTNDLVGPATLLGLGGLALLVIDPASQLAGLEVRSRPVYLNVIARASCLAAVIFCVAVTLPDWEALRASTFAVAIGLDGALTCEQLGWEARPFKWHANLLRSGFHLGIVGAFIAAVVSGVPTAVILAVFVTLHVWAATATSVLWLVSRARVAQRKERADALASVVEAERRARAHWLHDDVCAHLRLISLRIQTTSPSQQEVLELLDDFDHQLRLRQLDELLGSGGTRIGELLQPYIRNAQNQRVEIVGVPSFEDAAHVLPENAARLSARAVKVLTSNALNAGATSIAYEVHLTATSLHLTVHDNATGFSLADVPHGRGLWTLTEELRPGGVEVHENSDGGASVTAHIPLVPRGTLVQSPLG